MATEGMDRRRLLQTGAAAAIGTVLGAPRARIAAQTATTKPARQLIWANLLHLSYNMWCDWDSPTRKGRHSVYKPYLRCDQKLWDDLLQQMARVGMNMVIIDLGDGVKYESHPEIAVKEAWTTDRLKAELAKIRKLGLEPIPKLNFSTTHDAWLNTYARSVSTDAYYAVCRDLIAEVIGLFGKPRFFHLGMDEETAKHQSDFQYVVVRQYDLWWNDFYFYVEQVGKGGCRPWIWSDYLWHHPDDFFKKMPKSVLQSNWHYDTKFDKSIPAVKAYLDLDDHGYDQVPTGSNHSHATNFGLTVDYGKRHIPPARLLGFMQTPWRPTLEALRQHHTEAIDQVGEAIARFTSSQS